ncbi:Endothiapepsin [Podospora conica]|nr:Endothiapepsin [Schizothecium conicum]
MRVSSLVTVLFGAGALAFSPTSSSPGRISLGQVANPDFKRAPLPVAIAKAYRKYNKPIPEGLANALRRHGGSKAMSLISNGTGTAQAVPGNDVDVEYLTPVEIGTPPQTMHLDVDTGSSDLWVFSTLTPKSMVDGQNLYNPNASTTSKFMKGSSWWIFYGDGSDGRGSVFTDVVSFGNLSFPKQAVQVALEVSLEFTKDSSNSGLMGLGFSNGNTILPVPQPTFFDNINSSLQQPVFTADLKRHAPGHYNFGYIDHSAYIGNISYSPVDESHSWWLFNVSGFAIGNDTFHKTPLRSIADTGTSLMMMDKRLVKMFWTQVPGARFDKDIWGYVYPCNATLPDLVLGTNTSHTQRDEPLRIPGFLLQYGRPDTNGECLGGIQDSPQLDLNIIGDTGLKAAFVVHELGPFGKSRIGFANKHVSH